MVSGNDILTIGGGIDTVNGGAGNSDLLIVDYSTDTGSFNMAAGNTQFTDFSNTNVTFTGIERFDVTFRWVTTTSSSARAATGQEEVLAMTA